MSVKIKINLSECLLSEIPIFLDLGCGNSKHPGSIGIDKVDLDCVDIVGDWIDCLKLFPDESVSKIYSRSFLPHVEDLELVIDESLRLLKPDGTHSIFVPHFSNPFFYSDYTHKKFFGLYTFYYFVDIKDQLSRKVPTFYSERRIVVDRIKLVFWSPYRGRRLFKRLLSIIFNSSRWMQEFYEENLVYIFPCYGIELVYSKVASD